MTEVKKCCSNCLFIKLSSKRYCYKKGNIVSKSELELSTNCENFVARLYDKEYNRSIKEIIDTEDDLGKKVKDLEKRIDILSEEIKKLKIINNE